MANLQNSAPVHSGTALLGNYIMEWAASSGVLSSSAVNLGLGALTGFTETWEKYAAQEANGPAMIEGVATHTLQITFDLFEFWPVNFDNLRGGNFDVETASTSAAFHGTGASTGINAFSTGGKTTLSPGCIKLTNYSFNNGSTSETVIVVYKAYADAGMTLAIKTDSDTDPVNATQWTIIGKLDTARTKGDQLFKIETDLG